MIDILYVILLTHAPTCIIGACFVYFLLLLFKQWQWSQFSAIEDINGHIVGYRHRGLKANDYVQYAAAYSQYKPVYDVAGNVGGFRFVSAAVAEEEEDPATVQ